MDPDRLASRKEIAPEPPHILAIGKLINYKPRFSRYSKKNKGGVLDIVKEENSWIYGIIYGIKKQYLYLIDKAEGAPYSYRRIQLNIEVVQILDNNLCNSKFLNKKYVECCCYEVIEKSSEEIPPSKEYMSHVRMGCKYGVNIEQIEKIISRIGYYEDYNS